jgi:transposase-like protein
MYDELGYSKYDYANKDTDNSRNGYSMKNVVSSMGEIGLDIPRDRNVEFESRVTRSTRQISQISKTKSSACMPRVRSDYPVNYG